MFQLLKKIILNAAEKEILNGYGVPKQKNIGRRMTLSDWNYRSKNTRIQEDFDLSKIGDTVPANVVDKAQKYL